MHHEKERKENNKKRSRKFWRNFVKLCQKLSS